MKNSRKLNPPTLQQNEKKGEKIKGRKKEIHIRPLNFSMQ